MKDIHGWFGLSYASYLVVPRVLLEQMPAGWQHEFVLLLERAHEEYPDAPTGYTVYRRDERGRFLADPLRQYRYPDFAAIQAAQEVAR